MRKIIITVIALIALLSISTVLFSYFRLISLDQNIFLRCDNSVQRNCLDLTLHHYLHAPYWVAIQSALQLLMTITIIYFATNKTPTFSIPQSLVIGTITAIALLNIIDPGRLLAIVVFIGSAIGGSISAFKNKPSIQTDNIKLL